MLDVNAVFNLFDEDLSGSVSIQELEKNWPHEILKLWSKTDVRKIKSFQKSTLAPLKTKFSP